MEDQIKELMGLVDEYATGVASFGHPKFDEIRRKSIESKLRTMLEMKSMSEDIERVAIDRYKVVPANKSMFHEFAVVAGDGAQQLYLGREVECANMARKFAGAFLDGAFVATHGIGAE